MPTVSERSGSEVRSRGVYRYGFQRLPTASNDCQRLPTTANDCRRLVNPHREYEYLTLRRGGSGPISAPIGAGSPTAKLLLLFGVMAEVINRYCTVPVKF